MRLTKKKQPRTDLPERARRFALLPKRCQPLWGGCGETVWLEWTDAVRWESSLGNTYYIPLCARCAEKEAKKGGF